MLTTHRAVLALPRVLPREGSLQNEAPALKVVLVARAQLIIAPTTGHLDLQRILAVIGLDFAIEKELGPARHRLILVAETAKVVAFEHKPQCLST